MTSYYADNSYEGQVGRDDKGGGRNHEYMIFTGRMRFRIGVRNDREEKERTKMESAETASPFFYSNFVLS
jgi:hypothetical protein